MSLILRLNESGQGSDVIDRSTEILRRHFGYEVIRQNHNLSKLSEIPSDGKHEVIVNGHGDQNSLGEKSPDQLADLLAKGGLRGPVMIKLIA